MFISWQTHDGIQISVHSVIEATKYLVAQGIEFALKERFNQDCAENILDAREVLDLRMTIHQ